MASVLTSKHATEGTGGAASSPPTGPAGPTGPVESTGPVGTSSAEPASIGANRWSRGEAPPITFAGPTTTDMVTQALRASGLHGRDVPGPTRLPRTAPPAHHPALDGIRALAVSMVVAFHLGVRWATGGFVGVDVFFVLSGFLITGLLVQSHTFTGTVGLPRFWKRRAVRLLPALLLLLLVLAAVAAMDPRLLSLRSLRVNGLVTLFYVQNWHLALQSHAAHLADIFTPSPLLHTWSLAIEEQFYLLWPLVVAIALRRKRGRPPQRRRLWLAIVAGAAASAAAMAVMSVVGFSPLPIYYDSGARAFELLIGAGLALALPLAPSQTGAPVRPISTSDTPAAQRRKPAGRWFDAGGILAVLAVIAFMAGTPGIDEPWLYRGGLVAAAAAAALMITAVVMAPRGVVSRLLSWRPVAALGRISYGIYLWHWPVLVLVTSATVPLHGAELIALQLALTLVAALASWLLVEQPSRQLLLRRNYRRNLRPSGLFDQSLPQ